MADPIDTRAFEAMQDATPDTDITALETSVDDYILREAENSFNDFIGFLPSMSKFETDKLEELWIAGGKPMIKVHGEGEENPYGEKDRAYFRNLFIKGDEKKHVDMMGIYKPTLLENFMAEISHSLKYALKEGESKESWINRRGRLDERVAEQRRIYGGDVYGKYGGEYDFIHTEKSFPTEYAYGPTFGIATLEKDVPKEYKYYDERKYIGDERTPELQLQPEFKYTKFDPKTRLGSEGQRLLEEFEAHKVVEDSLWGVWIDVLTEAYGE